MVTIKTNTWKLQDIDFVIFDKDGTFIDIHTYWGKIVELRAKKVILYFNMQERYFKPLCSVMGYDLNTKKLPPDSPVGLYARGKVQEILLNYLLSQNIEAYMEDIETIFQEVNKEFLSIQKEYTTTINTAIDFIEKLKEKNVKMGVITSDSKNNAKKTIEENGLNDCFMEIFGAEDSETSKTTGDIVEKMLSKLNIEPQNTICIGDTFDDYKMAMNSRIKTCINVSTGVVTKKQHQEYNIYTVNDLSELIIE